MPLTLVLFNFFYLQGLEITISYSLLLLDVKFLHIRCKFFIFACSTSLDIFLVPLIIRT